MQTDTIRLGDCLRLMDEIEDNRIDLILCDLPYGTTACKWDTVLPLELIWNHYKRILKKDGVVVLFGSQPFTSRLILSNVEWFREEIVWMKNRSASGLRANTRHLKIHENIIVFAPTGEYTYNPQKWNVPEKQFLTQRKTMSVHGIGNNVYGSCLTKRKPDDGTRNPISVVAYPVPVTPAKTKTYQKEIDIRKHPTQKPLKLMEYLIKTYTNPGEIVLDSCMGSGTTCVAAIKTGRHYIGYEKDEQIFQIAESRIKDAWGNEAPEE